MRAVWFSLLVLFGLSGPAQAGEECLDLRWEGPRGELCFQSIGDPAKAYRLRIKLAKRKPVDFEVELGEDEKLLTDRLGTLDLKNEVLVWLPIQQGFAGHTLMLAYRIKGARWEKLPVRWVCRRRCTLQHVSYQTTISGGPPNTRVFYETVVNGQHLKSTYRWDGKRLFPVEIQEPRNEDALKRGFEAPELTPVCQRTPKVRQALEKRLRLACHEIGVDQLVTITRLNLSGENIHKLRAGDFSGLSELTSLDLTNNPLPELPPKIFDGLFKLRSLTFQGCQLTSIPGGIFKHLGSLKDLYLNHNKLKTLPKDAFEGLSSLTFLSLNHNRLASLPPGIFNPLGKGCNVYVSNNRGHLKRPD